MIHMCYLYNIIQGIINRKSKKGEYMLYHGNCLEVMPKLMDKSIDLILTDLPYGVSNHHWDQVIPLPKLWEEYKRIIKDSGIIILTATQPFASQLVMSNLEWFRYDLIWEKTISSNQLNVRSQPLRSHESILIFYRNRGVYNEQLGEGTPYTCKRKAQLKSGYNAQKASEKVNKGYRHARSVVKISNPRIRGGHPTEKPVELLEYLIRTYSNETDVVLDSAMGSGSLGSACMNCNRKFIGIEMDPVFFESARKRLFI